MNIYHDEGVDAIVDLRLAAAELRRSDGMAPQRRKETIAEISAAALLDIAGSLRVLAAESSAAMADYFRGVDLDTTPDDDDNDDAPDLIVEGDLVAVEGYAEPGEVTKFRFTEGEFFAEVAFADGSSATVALAHVTRLVGDERDDDALQNAAGLTLDDEGVLLRGDDVEPEADIDVEIPDPADLVDDIDADFDGAVHPAAASALDLLAANEAARKAAKKSGPKKGKHG